LFVCEGKARIESGNTTRVRRRETTRREFLTDGDDRTCSRVGKRGVAVLCVARRCASWLCESIEVSLPSGRSSRARWKPALVGEGKRHPPSSAHRFFERRPSSTTTPPPVRHPTLLNWSSRPERHRRWYCTLMIPRTRLHAAVLRPKTCRRLGSRCVGEKTSD
jgi:hypothetical protein